MGILGDVWQGWIKNWFPNAPGQIARDQLRLDRENFKLQEEALDYSKTLQQQIFDREDNSIQRRVEDLQKAGMSPVLAAGQGARAGGVVPIKAPQHPTSGKAMQLEAVQRSLQMKLDVSRSIAETLLIKSQADKNIADTRRSQQATSHELRRFNVEIQTLVRENNYQMQTLANRIARDGFNTKTAEMQSLIKEAETYIKSVDSQYVREARNWVIAQTEHATGEKGYNLANNPAYIDIMTGKVLKMIAEHDLDYYQSLGTPSKGQATPWGILGEVIGEGRNLVRDALDGKGIFERMQREINEFRLSGNQVRNRGRSVEEAWDTDPGIVD